MKYLITWRVHKAERHEALKAFSAMTDEDHAKDLGGVRLVGRWHDVIGFTGAAIAETDDPKALSAWLLNWNGIIDVKARPVLDDQETAALGRETFG